MGSKTTKLSRKANVTIRTIIAVVGLAFAGAFGLIVMDAHNSSQERNYFLENSSKVWQSGHVVELASMANGQKVEGSGNIFLSHVSEESVIRYTEKLSSGYRLGEISSRGVLIKEVDFSNEKVKNKQPRIEYQECVLSADNSKAYEYVEDGKEVPCGKRTVIYVPVGSVTQDFTLDPGAK